MTHDTIYGHLQTQRLYDIIFDSSVPTNNGFKVSIQGKTINDSAYLYTKLHQYLYNNNIPFKVGTQKRVDLTTEQGNKVMTIYCPNAMDVNCMAEEIYALIPEYKGWYNVNTPTGYTHYAGGLFICSDRDSDGNYIFPEDR